MYFYLYGILVYCRDTPSLKVACSQLNTLLERGTVRKKCLTQEHNGQGLKLNHSIQKMWLNVI